MTMYIDKEQVRRALSILHPEGELFEIRIIQESKKIFSGYFRSIDAAIADLVGLTDYHLRDANVYTILNSIDEACYSRKQCGHIIMSKVTTGDSDITRLKWLFIDFDPKRPSGTSSTDAQVEAAKNRAMQVSAYLNRKGFPEPIVGMSGNGFHLLYRMDLPKAAAETVKVFLQTLQALYSDDSIDIDTGNFNPARPCKLYGTLAQKGTGTPERPHRMAYIAQAPEEIQEVSLECIKEVIEEKPTKGKETKQHNNSSGNSVNTVKWRFSSEEEFEAWMRGYGIEWTQKKRYFGYVLYVLPQCLFDESHTGSCASLSLSDDGIPGYKCKHVNTCGHRKWRDVRMKYEPEAYRQTYDDDDGSIDAGWREHKKMMIPSRAKEAEQNTKGESNADANTTAIEIEKTTQTVNDTKTTEPAPEMVFRSLKKASDLLKKDLPPFITYVGSGEDEPFLGEGTCILSSKPKLGKSWFVLALCLAVAQGKDFLGYKTRKCSTLYLDLETGENLQQKRINKILAGEPCPDNFYIDGETRTLSSGLIEQLEYYMQQDPNIGIVVIDVFQRIKSARSSLKESDYEHAYRDIPALQKFSEKYHISIILVTHDRKAVDPDDPFANILGSIGQQGAAMQLMVMYQRRRGDPIHIVTKGKGIDGQPEMDISFNDGQWSVVSAVSSIDHEKEQLMREYIESPIRSAIVEIANANLTWKGRCSSIVNDATQLGIGITDTPREIGGFLHRHQGRFFEEDQIKLQFISNGTGPKIYKIERYNPEIDTSLEEFREI